MHVYRWDLDKTYLDTDIDSVRGLIRAAVEPAADKRNVPGSGSLLRAVCAKDPSARVCILSGSPEQMRPVLEEKLHLDGIQFHDLILKDSVARLRRGRLRAVRGQVGYKLPHLLSRRVGLGPAVRETLFGDDSEADAVVYALYADALAGRADATEVRRVLKSAGAYEDEISVALDALSRLGRMEVVEDIFITLQRRVPVQTFGLLGGRVTPVHSWFQAALVLWWRQRIDDAGLQAVAVDCDRSPVPWEGWVQDAVRRGLVPSEVALAAIEAIPRLKGHLDRITRAVRRLGDVKSATPGGRPDYTRFLRAVRSR